MIIYLGGPIESDMAAGNWWRAGFHEELARRPKLAEALTVLDPLRVFVQPIFPGRIHEVAKVNRLLIDCSTLVVTLLAGQETWREIEYARSSGKPVWGMWKSGNAPSPMPVRDVEEFHNIVGLMDRLGRFVLNGDY